MQSWLYPHLKQLGFKVKGRTYNRLNANGLTEVINIQLGNSDPPGTTYIPDFTQNMYGLFTINLGVFVPEVHKYLDGWKLGSIIREVNCCVRRRLGSIEQQDEDIWWRLISDPQFFSLMHDTLVKNALPFFERYSTREKILREWEDQVGNTPESGSPPKLVCAMIYLEKGERAAAARLLYEQARDTHISQHRDYVNEIAIRLNLRPL